MKKRKKSERQTFLYTEYEAILFESRNDAEMLNKLALLKKRYRHKISTDWIDDEVFFKQLYNIINWNNHLKKTKWLVASNKEKEKLLPSIESEDSVLKDLAELIMLESTIRNRTEKRVWLERELSEEEINQIRKVYLKKMEHEREAGSHKR